MKILVIGGTRFFGIPMVKELLACGHEVVIASRGKAKDPFGNSVSRIILDRLDQDNMKQALAGMQFDVVIDKIAYCSNDIRNVMEILNCDKYLYMSTTAVYDPIHWNSKEEDFDGRSKKLVWCFREDFPYAEVKRQAECALSQIYPDKNWTAVRYPFVIGKDDYTRRLFFYVEHTMKSVPMQIDNLNCQMSFIQSEEAGRFMAFLADRETTGAFNGSSSGTISIREILNYVEEKSGKKAILDEDGEPAPYNGTPKYSINIQKAQKTGFIFTNLQDWIYELLDYYIAEVNANE